MKLEMIDEDFMEIKPPKRKLFNGCKKIDQLLEYGAVITGSRALQFYSIRGLPLISRKPEDCDVVMERESMIKFCNDNKIKFNQNNNILSANFSTGIYIGRYGYHTTEKKYLLSTNFDIISKDSLPEYRECGNYKICNIQYIIDEKIKLIKSLETQSTWSNVEKLQTKHKRDVLEILIKIIGYKDPLLSYDIAVKFGDYSINPNYSGLNITNLLDYVIKTLDIKIKHDKRLA